MRLSLLSQAALGTSSFLALGLNASLLIKTGIAKTMACFWTGAGTRLRGVHFPVLGADGVYGRLGRRLWYEAWPKSEFFTGSSMLHYQPESSDLGTPDCKFRPRLLICAETPKIDGKWR